MPDLPPEPAELRRLARRLASMPARVREVFERHRYANEPLERIAASLTLDVRAVERLLAEAMRHLDERAADD